MEIGGLFVQVVFGQNINGIDGSLYDMVIVGVESCLDFKYSNEGSPGDTIALNDDDCSKELFYICEGI